LISVNLLSELLKKAFMADVEMNVPKILKVVYKSHLNDTFPNQWICCGSTISWPTRYPDLTPSDFCIWELDEE
jgi:hypothetical protein